MDLSANLHLTQKGEDEIKRRAYKLSMRKRSVLILLDKPRPVEQVFAKCVFPQNEVVEEIEALIQDGFISLGGEVSTVSPPTPQVIAPATSGTFHLDDEIIVSEAKFMLTDFAVDSFGTQSQGVVDAIRACKNVQDVRLCLSEILAATEKQCPNRVPVLLGLIKEINETA